MADDKKKMSRRGLFSLFGVARANQPKAAGTFSLEAFYRARENAGSSEALPEFTLREGLPDAADLSTAVGVAELADRTKRDESK